jgi:hypothetical protein
MFGPFQIVGVEAGAEAAAASHKSNAVVRASCANPDLVVFIGAMMHENSLSSQLFSCV